MHKLLQAVAEREQQALRVTLHNYMLCLARGDMYDLRASFRLVQLWLDLGETTPWVNDQAALAFEEVPSHKFLPLAYQCASRLGAPTAGVRRCRGHLLCFVPRGQQHDRVFSPWQHNGPSLDDRTPRQLAALHNRKQGAAVRGRRHSRGRWRGSWSGCAGSTRFTPCSMSWP